jgi:hypothetical protein
MFLLDSRDKTLVLANSHPDGCGSFIMRNGSELKSWDGKENKIRLVDLGIKLVG